MNPYLNFLFSSHILSSCPGADALVGTNSGEPAYALDVPPLLPPAIAAPGAPPAAAAAAAAAAAPEPKRVVIPVHTVALGFLVSSFDMLLTALVEAGLTVRREGRQVPFSRDLIHGLLYGTPSAEAGWPLLRLLRMQGLWKGVLRKLGAPDAAQPRRLSESLLAAFAGIREGQNQVIGIWDFGGSTSDIGVLVGDVQVVWADETRTRALGLNCKIQENYSTSVPFNGSQVTTLVAQEIKHETILCMRSAIGTGPIKQVTGEYRAGRRRGPLDFR
jgi:hypothetical protein